MSTPSCPVCGRWDGSHSGGCPRTGIAYKPADLAEATPAPVTRSNAAIALAEAVEAAIARFALDGVTAPDAVALADELEAVIVRASCVVDHDHLADGSTSDGLDCHPATDWRLS